MPRAWLRGASLAREEGGHTPGTECAGVARAPPWKPASNPISFLHGGWVVNAPPTCDATVAVGLPRAGTRLSALGAFCQSRGEQDLPRALFACGSGRVRGVGTLSWPLGSRPRVPRERRSQTLDAPARCITCAGSGPGVTSLPCPFAGIKTAAGLFCVVRLPPGAALHPAPLPTGR